jgi:hypothetical protein
MIAQTIQEQYVTDAAGHRTHVILPVEFYERLKMLVGDGKFTLADTYPAQERVAATDWDTPEMEAYDAL